MAAEVLGDTPVPLSPSDGDTKLSQHAQEILKITRDTEFLHSFLRVGDGETDSEAGDFRGPATHKSSGAAGGGQKGTGDDRADGEGPSRAATLADRSHGHGHAYGHDEPVHSRRGHHKTTFKEVVKELELSYGGLGALAGKKGRRGKSIRGEEVYTDKDRAAAVQMGHRDIKQSLRMKRHQERVRALQLPEEADATTLLALGQYELRQGNTHIAIAFVNKALQLSPEDKSALVARSRCYLLLGQPRLALQDAETALEPDKNFVRAIFQKAEALYHLGDFEHSLMYYHRGLRLRPELAMFRLGVQKAQEAIENTIGTGIEESCKIMEQVERARAVRARAGTKGKVKGPLKARTGPAGSGSGTAASSSTAGRRSRSSVSPSSAGSARSRGSGGSAGSPSERIGSASVSGSAAVVGLPKRVDSCTAEDGQERSARRLLGELCVDKLYLEQLLKHPDIRCAHKETSSRISSHAEDGVEFLRNRQEFWRQQKLSTGPGGVATGGTGTGTAGRSRPAPLSPSAASTPASRTRRTLA